MLGVERGQWYAQRTLQTWQSARRVTRLVRGHGPRLRITAGKAGVLGR